MLRQLENSGISLESEYLHRLHRCPTMVVIDIDDPRRLELSLYVVLGAWMSTV
jgi:hypothetical protein